MKYLSQFLLILGFTLAGEALQRLLPIPVPASVYGLVLLFLVNPKAGQLELRTNLLEIIDVFTAILAPMFENMDSLAIKILVNGLGCVILAFGMTIVMKSDAGTGPNDLVGIVISDKLKKNFGVIRIIVDVSFVAIGFILGGSLGIGTLICAFLVGPVANIFLPFNEKWINNVVKNFK